MQAHLCRTIDRLYSTSGLQESSMGKRTRFLGLKKSRSKPRERSSVDCSLRPRIRVSMPPAATPVTCQHQWCAYDFCWPHKVLLLCSHLCPLCYSSIKLKVWANVHIKTTKSQFLDQHMLFLGTFAHSDVLFLNTLTHSELCMTRVQWLCSEAENSAA